MPHRCRNGCGSPYVRSAGGIRSLCFVACNAVDGRSSSIPPCRTRSWPAIRSSDPIPSDGSGAAVRTQPTRRRGESHRPVEIHSKRSANSSTHFLGPPPEPPRTRSSGDPWATSRTTSAARSNGCRMRNLRTFGSRICIFAIYARVYVLDRVWGETFVIAPRTRIAYEPPPIPDELTVPPEPHPIEPLDRAEYDRTIDEAKQAIYDGEIYQVNLSDRVALPLRG